jgi:hypothetical protein
MFLTVLRNVNATQILAVFPGAKSSLNANNCEVDNHVFSVDEQNEENGWILALMGKKKFMS